MTKYAYFGPLRGRNSGTHDWIWLVQERNQDLLVIQVVCKFGSNQIKNETTIEWLWQIVRISALKGP